MYIYNSIGIIKICKMIKKKGGEVYVYKCKYIVGDFLQIRNCYIFIMYDFIFNVIYMYDK